MEGHPTDPAHGGKMSIEQIIERYEQMEELVYLLCDVDDPFDKALFEQMINKARELDRRGKM